jgi:hypothetical protein
MGLTASCRYTDGEFCLYVGLVKTWESLAGMVTFKLGRCQVLGLVLGVQVADAKEPDWILIEIGGEPVGESNVKVIFKRLTKL